MIQFENVTKTYYTVTALDGVSLKVPAGEVLGILGPNGAGKSTLMKLIAGFIMPTRGTVRPISGGWPRIGYKPERLLFPNHLTVTQYLELVAGSSNVPSREVERTIYDSLARVNLLESAGRKIGHLSKGMRQRLGLAQATLGDPALLLLDEPSNGLDPEGQVEIGRYIQDIHASGKTILINSHHLHEVTQVATELIVLNHGRVHYRNRMADALALQPSVRIHCDRALDEISALLQSLSPNLSVEGSTVILRDDAMRLRRHVLTLVLSMGYDVLRVEQQRTTLAEIYAEAVQ